MNRNGHCTECGNRYPAEYVEDGLCPQCEAVQPHNDPRLNYDGVDMPSRMSRGAIRERLSVSWNEDV